VPASSFNNRAARLCTFQSGGYIDRALFVDEEIQEIVRAPFPVDDAKWRGIEFYFFFEARAARDQNIRWIAFPSAIPSSNASTSGCARKGGFTL